MKKLRDLLIPFRPENLPTKAELSKHLAYDAWINSVLNSDPGDFQAIKDLPDFVRKDYISEVGFFLLNKDVVEAIASYLRGKSVVEVGAGSGALASSLNQYGANVVASDVGNQSKWSIAKSYGLAHCGDSVEWLNTELVPDVVIMSWPGYGHMFSNNIFNKMKSGQTLLYIGERDGCTGAADFEDILIDRAVEDTLATSLISDNYISWPGIHDYVRVFLIK